MWDMTSFMIIDAKLMMLIVINHSAKDTRTLSNNITNLISQTNINEISQLFKSGHFSNAFHAAKKSIHHPRYCQ
jgi:hypothetical protein